MMALPLPPQELRYLALRAALELFQRALPQLNAEEMAQVQRNAQQQQRLQQLILSSTRAAQTRVSATQLQQALQEIRARYTQAEDFIEDLARNELTEEQLEAALRRALLVENILEQVGLEAAPVTDAEIDAFYAQHQARFSLPETRTARQILLTINDDYKDNQRDKAWQRM